MLSELALFAAAFAVSAPLPGPDTLLLFGRAVSSGAAPAVHLAIGLTLGKLALLSAAVAGVTAAAATLGPFFAVLKVAGGAYLVWLAVRLLRRRDDAPAAEPSPRRARAGNSPAGWRGVGLGAALTLSNPQALLFYVAVLPSVVDAKSVGAGQYLALCLTLSAVMSLVAAGYITVGVRARTALARKRRRSAERLGAVLLGTTGVLIALR